MGYLSLWFAFQAPGHYLDYKDLQLRKQYGKER
jgi:hypothetical protein